MTKRYDRAYFDHWYRDDAAGVGRGELLRRKVALAVALAEHHLGRPVRSVLDVGCGEGAWRAPLLKLRPDLDYLGVDGSAYAVARHGARRNLRQLQFGQLAEFRPGASVDLLVCADVLHYIAAAEVRRGLGGFADLCHGVAYVETFCRGDAVEGDVHGFIPRSAAFYLRALADAGFTACGSHGYLAAPLAADAVALELGIVESARRPARKSTRRATPGKSRAPRSD